MPCTTPSRFQGKPDGFCLPSVISLCQLPSAGHFATRPEWGQPKRQAKKVATSDFVGRSAFCAGRASAAALLLSVSFVEWPGHCELPSTCPLSVLVRLACWRTVLKKCIFCLPCPFLTTQLSQTPLFNALHLSTSHVGQADTEG